GVEHTGQKAYVAKLASDGSALAYLSFTGGSFDDVGAAIAVDAAGDAFILGQTTSDDLPVTAAALQSSRRGPYNSEDNFVMKIGPSGSTILYATYLGGSRSERFFEAIYAGGFRLDGLVI